MVYEGKPSAGCKTCRNRRIKCDTARPICGQCLKSKRECSGYRDTRELVFINQTQAASSKGKTKRKRRGPSSSLAESSSDSGESGALDFVPRATLETVEKQALCHFIGEFVLVPRHSEASRGYIEFLLPVYAEAKPESPIFAATMAASMAAFSQLHSSDILLTQSRVFYGKAVTTLQEVVNDPIESRSDATLMTVLLLNLYETITETEVSLFQLGYHADGATALLHQRGEEMMSETVSRRLYWAVRFQAMIKCLVNCEPLEPYTDWKGLWTKPVLFNDQDAANNLTYLGMRLPALRYASYRHLKEPMSGAVALDIVNLMGHARILDQLFAAWSFEVPLSWKPTLVGILVRDIERPKEADIYPGSIDSYDDIWKANIWNCWRVMRICCHAIILNCAERLFPASALMDIPEYCSAIAIIKRMADGLCASVPYHLGCVPATMKEETRNDLSSTLEKVWKEDSDTPRNRSSPSPPSRSTEVIGGHFLLWQLFITCSVVTIDRRQREWMNGRLDYIGRKYGVGQATALASLATQSLQQQGRNTSITDMAPPPYTSFLGLAKEVRRERTLRGSSTGARDSRRPGTPEELRFESWKRDILHRLGITA